MDSSSARCRRATALGLRLDRIDVAAESGLDAAIARAKGGALVVLGDPMFWQNRGTRLWLGLRRGLGTAQHFDGGAHRFVAYA